MPGFVYVMQPDDMPMFKVGVCSDPFARLAQIQPFSPHRLRFVRVLDVGCHWRAKAFEKYVLSWVSLHQAWGEWSTSLEAIDQHLAVCAPAIDVTDEYLAPPPKPVRFRKPRALSDLERDLRHAAKARAERLQFVNAGSYLPSYLGEDEPDVIAARAKPKKRASRSPAEAAG